MILQDEHIHPPPQVKVGLTRKRKEIFDAKKQTQQYFQELLTSSKQIFNEKSIILLATLRQNCENKVYANLQQSSHHFLSILIKDRNSKLDERAHILQQQLHLRQKGVMKDLSTHNIAIQKNVKSIQTLKKELQQKLQIMRSKTPNNYINQQQVEALKKRQQIKQENYMQFRKDSYWKVYNQKKESISQFLKNIQSQQKKLRQRYKSVRQLNEKKKIEQQIQQKKQQSQRHIKEKMQLHEKHKESKMQRQKQIEQFSQKIKETQVFLAKFKNKIPPHLLFSQEEKKVQAQQQQRINGILEDLREKKRQLSLSEIKDSLRDYEQYKQRHAEQLQQRKMIELQQQRMVKSRLNRLYKSKVRAFSAQQQASLNVSQHKIKQQKAMKMLMYSQKIKEKHLPKVDPEKRESLLHSIQDSIKKEHKIQKIKEGELILLNKNDFNPRQIGLKYLEEVKQITSLIQRKPSPPPEEKGIKIIDRSKLKNTFYNKHMTITNWKEIIKDEKLNESEKEVRLQNYFKLIQQQQSKSLKAKKSSSLSKSINLQKKIDHYELQKAAAKLALLKSMA